MRWWSAWVVVALIACGKAQSDSEATPIGGSAPGGAGSLASAGGAGSASTPSGGTSTGGGTSASGGSDAGRVGTAGSVSAGGSDTLDAGPAGSAGLAGAVAVGCGEPYDACGCRCCGSSPTATSCYYPERGDSRESIVQQDETAARNPACASAACAAGARRVCCTAPGGEPDASSYEVTGYIGAFDRLTIHRTSFEQRCTTLTLVALLSSPSKFPIDVPEGWSVETNSDFACEDRESAAASSRRYAVGGIGRAQWNTVERCALDFDFTLFFVSQDGTVEPIRFASERVPVPASVGGSCSGTP